MSEVEEIVLSLGGGKEERGEVAVNLHSQLHQAGGEGKGGGRERMDSEEGREDGLQVRGAERGRVLGGKRWGEGKRVGKREECGERRRGRRMEEGESERVKE